MKLAYKDLTGQVFSRLTVLKYLCSKNNHAVFLCRCGCGANTEVKGIKLRSGATKSCGCLKKSGALRRVHGYKGSRIYRIWVSMRFRCNNKNDKGYPNYGGRGIRVCKRWNTFTNFLEDMGEPPEGLSLDRINVDGNYEPSNCRWATADTQANNARSNIKISFNGITMNASQWARLIGIDRRLLVSRYRKGWPLKDVLSAKKFSTSGNR